MLSRKLYYLLKPLIPRRVQLNARRRLIASKLRRCGRTWPILEAAGASADGRVRWSGGRRFALVLTHDVDTAKGQSRCLPLAELEQGRGF